jgi:hypothetical protein
MNMTQHGEALLSDPIRNKGTAFTRKSAANTGSKGCCPMRSKASTGSSSG